MFRALFLSDLWGLSARVLELLGPKHAAAAQQAAEEALQNARKSSVRWEAWAVLGRLAAARGDAKTAEAHFEAACQEARVGGVYGLELLGLHDPRVEKRRGHAGWRRR